MKTSARKLFAKRVRELRTARGWSQDELAAAARLARTYIATIELGNPRGGIDEVEKVATALNVPIPALFRK